jgi:hypothetical protein
MAGGLQLVDLSAYSFTEGPDEVSSSRSFLDVGAVANTVSGSDVITGESDDSLSPIRIMGTLFTGGGADTITGWKSIHTDFLEADIVIGFGAVIRMGAGGDALVSSTVSGIYSKGTVYMGDGNDRIFSRNGSIWGGHFFMGAGADTVSGLCGMPKVLGSRPVSAAPTHDTSFYGGAGKDRLVLADGVYQLSKSTSTAFYYLKSFETADKHEGNWSFTSFEVFGVPDKEFKISDIPLGNFEVLNGEVLLPPPNPVG